MMAGPGQEKLPPTISYGSVEKNYSEQFIAWISREANNTFGIRAHSASHISRSTFVTYAVPQLVTVMVFISWMLVPGVTKIQNKIVAAAARIRSTGRF